MASSHEIELSEFLMVEATQSYIKLLVVGQYVQAEAANYLNEAEPSSFKIHKLQIYAPAETKFYDFPMSALDEKSQEALEKASIDHVEREF